MLSFEGSDYDFDIDKTTVEELREIKRKFKLTGRGVLRPASATSTPTRSRACTGW